MQKVIKELNYEERATWGACPVCGAKPGEWCDANTGFVLGVNIHGKPPTDGAHLARLNNAPFRVELVPVD